MNYSKVKLMLSIHMASLSGTPYYQQSKGALY